MNRVLKILILWFIIGSIYFIIEGLWRIPTNGGYANIVMLPIGGLCGVIIGGINQIPAFYKLKVLWQNLIGVVLVLLIEFISGYVLNICFGLGIWDYSQMSFNIMGQVCLLYAFLWFLLIPFAIWVEDYLRWFFWQEGIPYSLWNIYFELICFK